MEKIIFTAGILLLPAVCTTVGAAGAFLFRRAQEPRTQRMTSGMAAGIMLAASVWSLLLPAIERAERGVWPGWFPPTAGLVVGAVGLLRLEALAGRWFAAGPGQGLSGRGSLRAGGTAGRAAGPCGGRLGERGSALADECGRRVHGLRNGAGDDPAGR